MNSPGCTCRFTSLTATNGPVGRRKDTGQTGELERWDQHAVSASTTRVRTRSASGFEPNDAGRGRDSGTGIGAAKRGAGSRRHRHDPVGQEDRLVDVVGDHQRRHAPRVGAQLRQLLAKGVARQRVERAEGLVQEQNLGLDGKRPGDRDPLPHAARQLTGLAIQSARRARRARGCAWPAPAARRGIVQETPPAPPAGRSRAR